MNKLSKQLAKEAQKKGICEDWHNKLTTLDDKHSMLKMYLQGIDFCLANDFPDNTCIRKHFKGMMEEHGIFLDDDATIKNVSKCVALGSTKIDAQITGYNVSEFFLKHDADVTLTVKNSAFVMIDLFDNARISVKAYDNAKLSINRYKGAGRIVPENNDNSVIKIRNKDKKTY